MHALLNKRAGIGIALLLISAKPNSKCCIENGMSWLNGGDSRRADEEPQCSARSTPRISAFIMAALAEEGGMLSV